MMRRSSFECSSKLDRCRVRHARIQYADGISKEPSDVFREMIDPILLMPIGGKCPDFCDFGLILERDTRANRVLSLGDNSDFNKRDTATPRAGVGSP